MIIERHKHENELPRLEKEKYLVPEDLTIASLTFIIRKRSSILDLIYLLDGEGQILHIDCKLGSIYKEKKDDDGYLYIQYTKERFYQDMDMDLSTASFLLAIFLLSEYILPWYIKYCFLLGCATLNISNDTSFLAQMLDLFFAACMLQRPL